LEFLTWKGEKFSCLPHAFYIVPLKDPPMILNKVMKSNDHPEEVQIEAPN
jgi:hypothetical protein